MSDWSLIMLYTCCIHNFMQFEQARHLPTPRRVASSGYLAKIAREVKQDREKRRIDDHAEDESGCPAVCIMFTLWQWCCALYPYPAVSCCQPSRGIPNASILTSTVLAPDSCSYRNLPFQQDPNAIGKPGQTQIHIDAMAGFDEHNMVRQML